MESTARLPGHRNDPWLLGEGFDHAKAQALSRERVETQVGLVLLYAGTSVVLVTDVILAAFSALGCRAADGASPTTAGPTWPRLRRCNTAT